MIWLMEGLRLLMRSRSRSLLLVLCWTMALLLAEGLGMAWRNSPMLRQAWLRRIPAECYLERADPALLKQVRMTLDADRVFAWDGHLSAEDAAREFEAGFGVDMIGLLGENPFPQTVMLRLLPEADSTSIERALKSITSLEGVQGVHLDRQLLGSLGRQVRRAVWAALVIVGLLSVLTAGLLYAAARSVTRSWKVLARLLALHGGNQNRLAWPPTIALVIPALSAAVLSLGFMRGLEALLDQMDLHFSAQSSMSIWVGILFPVLIVGLFIRATLRNIISDTDLD